MKEARDQLQQIIYGIINPVVKAFIKIGITPNMVTLIGLILNIVVTGILIFGAEKSNRGDLSYIGWAGSLILFAGLFDMLDGQVARMSNKSSKFGALFDSVLDRYSEMILFFGICYYLVAHHYFLSSVFAFLALIGSMMVSYIRSRAEGLGVECKGGLMQRPERVVLISVSAIACGIAASIIGSDFKIYLPNTKIQIFETMSIFTFPITLMAILTNWTAIGRLKEAKKALEKVDVPTTSTPKSLLNILLIFILLSGTAGSSIVKAQHLKDESSSFPNPPMQKNSLFYLQRTSNTNTIIYELNYTKENKIDVDEPVRVYWIRYTEPGNPIKPLNYIQRKFAYGIKAEKLGIDKWNLRMVAYNKLPITLKKGKEGNYRAFVTINSRDYIFQKAYIKVDGGSFWSPNIPYINIHAKGELDGKTIIHRINNPKKNNNG